MNDTPEFNTPSDELLRDWLTGQSKGAAHAIDMWANDRPSRLAWLTRLRETYDTGRVMTPALDVAGAFERVREQIRVERAEVRSVPVVRESREPRETRETQDTHRVGVSTLRSAFSRKMSFQRGSGKAMRPGMMAMLGVLTTIAGVMTIRYGAAPRPVAPRLYTTAVGQITTLVLDGGTRIVLAPQTTLRVVGNDRGARTVLLNGEAYFDIAHADDAPFVVRTGNVRTRVLGTSFFVRSSHNNSRVRVAVVTGKVVVSAQTPQKPSAVLAAGYAGDFTDSSAMVGRTEDVAVYSGWTNGRLVFRKAPTSEILAELTRWYGYEFRVTDTAIVSRNWNIVISTKSAQEALATLRLVFDVDLRIDNNIITLVSRDIRRDAPLERRIVPGNTMGDLIHQQREIGR